MLELNGWFFVMVVNFLVLMVILNKLLFQPMLEVIKKREAAIDGAIQEAEDMDAKKEEMITELNNELSDAAQEARAKFEGLKAEGTDQQKELLDKTAKEASGIIEGARAEIRTLSEEASSALKGEAERFSEEIVNKLIKV